MSHLIDRQEAIDTFRKEYGGIKNANIDGDFLADEIEFILSKLPTADVVERNRGKWVQNGAVEQCSKCGETREFPHWQFCPNCGADTREDTEDERR